MYCNQPRWGIKGVIAMTEKMPARSLTQTQTASHSMSRVSGSAPPSDSDPDQMRWAFIPQQNQELHRERRLGKLSNSSHFRKSASIRVILSQFVVPPLTPSALHMHSHARFPLLLCRPSTLRRFIPRPSKRENVSIRGICWHFLHSAT